MCTISFVVELRKVEVTSTPEEDDERRRQSFSDLVNNPDWMRTPSSSRIGEEGAQARRLSAFMQGTD